MVRLNPGVQSMDARLKARLQTFQIASTRRPLDEQLNEGELQSRLCELERDVELLAKSFEKLAVMVDRDRRFGADANAQCRPGQPQSEPVPQP